MTERPFARAAILGVGLIGSSIARALAAKLPEIEVRLYDASAEVRARAAALRLGRVLETAAEAVADADLIILATPVGAMGALAREIAPAIAPGAVVSDVGSVKAAVLAEVGPFVPAHASFVPAHPVAGTELSGPDAGFATLFERRWLILTPLQDPRPAYTAAVERLEQLWRAMGSEVARMDAAQHDLTLAITSHLPHLIAFTVVATAEDLETVTEADVVKYSAGGFRDFTRIAASDPTMWRDVFLSNRESVLEVLGRFSENLAGLQRAIRWGDGETLFALFSRARRVRREVVEAGQDTARPNWGRD
jgi:cyclohexadieny/prephenate dehydrogenase